MLKLDIETIEKEIDIPVHENEEYQEAIKQFHKALKENDAVKADDAATLIERITAEVTYKKAFHDGMRFILDTIAGREVIEL